MKYIIIIYKITAGKCSEVPHPDAIQLPHRRSLPLPVPRPQHSYKDLLTCLCPGHHAHATYCPTLHLSRCRAALVPTRATRVVIPVSPATHAAVQYSYLLVAMPV